MITRGLLRGIADGEFSAAIADSAFTYQQKLEAGEKKIVGVNTHTATVTGELEILRVGHDVERQQVTALAERRSRRDDAEVRRSLADLVAAVRGTDNLVEPMLRAARAEATLGEICGVLRTEWGEYVEVARF